MVNRPVVSIIVSAYNAGKFIRDTIQSVLNQTFIDFELIIVNDGSTDNTLQQVSQFNDPRIQVITQSNKGQDAALNRGYQDSSGDYIKFLDADDLISPEMIGLQVECLQNFPDCIAYSEWARFYNNQPELADFTKLDYWQDQSPVDFLTARPEGVMLQCGSILLPRSVINRCGLWDERLVLFNDTEFFTRAILASKGVRFTPGARLYYRSGQAQSISVQKSRKFYESTYLASCLIGENLLAAEDSKRVRTLVANLFLDRYYGMYPNFSDLGKLHVQKVKEFGYATSRPAGGRMFQLLSSFFGWKSAKILQWVSYKLGYLSVFSAAKSVARTLQSKFKTTA